MRFSQLPLLWRVFAINATLLVVATLLLVLARTRFHASLAFLEGLDVALFLVVMLVANLLLLRPTLKPIEQLAARMRTVDLLRPGQRLLDVIRSRTVKCRDDIARLAGYGINRE